MSILVKFYLFLSAVVLLLVGGMLSLAPEILYASSGQPLPETVMLRSDLRAGGVLLLASGLYVAAALLRSADLRTALQLSALIYLGYGMGRVLSIGFDGAPDAALLTVTAIEWALGLAAVVLLSLLPAGEARRGT